MRMADRSGRNKTNVIIEQTKVLVNNDILLSKLPETALNKQYY